MPEGVGSRSHSATDWLLSGAQLPPTPRTPRLEKEKVGHHQGFSNCAPVRTAFLWLRLT